MAAELEVQLRDRVSRNAKKASKSLDGLAREMRDVTAANRRMNTGFRRQNSRLRAASSGFSGAGKAATGMGLAMGGLAVAAGGVVGGLYAIKKAADFGQAVNLMSEFTVKTRVAFGQLLGDTTKGNEAFKTATDLSREYSIGLKDTAGQMKKLLAQQFSLKRSDELIKTVADLRAIGVEGEAANRVLRAITQISAKGKLQQEELLQLAEAGVSLKLVRKELQKTFGVTGKELDKLQRKGEVGGDAAIGAIQRAILKKTGSTNAGDAAKKAAAILPIAQRLELAGERFLFGVAERSSGAQKSLTGLGKDLAKHLDNPSIVNGIGDAIGRLGGRLDRLGPSLSDGFGAGLEFLSEGLSRSLDLGGAFLESFVGGLSSAFPTLKSFFDGPTDKGLILLFESIGAQVGMITAKFIKIIDVTSDVATGLSSAMGYVSNFVGATTSILTGGGDPWTSVGVNMANGIKTGLQSGQLGETMAGIGRGMLHSFKSVLGINSPSKEFMRLGAFAESGLAKGLAANNNADRASAGLGASVSASLSRGMGLPSPRPNYGRSPAAAMRGSSSSTTNYFEANNSFEINEAGSGEDVAAEAGAGVQFGLGQAMAALAS